MGAFEVFLLIGFIFFVSQQISKQTGHKHQNFAEAASRLEGVRQSDSLGGVQGKLNGLRVSARISGGGTDRRIDYRVILPPPGLPFRVRLRTSVDRLHEPRLGSPNTAPGVADDQIAVGHDDFDRNFVVSGDADAVRSILGRRQQDTLIPLIFRLGDVQVTETEIRARSHWRANGSEIAKSLSQLAAAADSLVQSSTQLPASAPAPDQLARPARAPGLVFNDQQLQAARRAPDQVWEVPTSAGPELAPQASVGQLGWSDAAADPAVRADDLRGGLAAGLRAVLNDRVAETLAGSGVAVGAVDLPIDATATTTPVSGAAPAPAKVHDSALPPSEHSLGSSATIESESEPVVDGEPPLTIQQHQLAEFFDSERSGPLPDELLNRSVRWVGEVKRTAQFRMDFDFSGGPGVKANVLVGAVKSRFGSNIDIEAVLELPEGTELARGENIAFSGQVIKVDSLLHHVFVAEATVS